MSYYPHPAPPHHPSPSPAPSSSRQDLDLIVSLSSPNLQPTLKASTALQAVDPLSRILLAPDSDLPSQKLALAALATAYPFLFKYVTQTGDQAWWGRVIALKTAVLQLWRNGSVGAKVAAVKVIQRVIQTQTTSGTVDPRRQAGNAEPNLSLCRPNHPFLKIAQLEDESNKLLEECITTLFTSPIPDVISAIVSVLVSLIKSRPQLGKLVVTSLTNWSPAALAGQSPLLIRSVEKVVRLSLTHLLKHNHAPTFAPQISDFLAKQLVRMEQAAVQSKKQKEEDASKKRQLLSSQIETQSKRRRLNTSNPLRAFSSAHPSPHLIPAASDLPLTTVVEAVITVLQTSSPTSFAAAIDAVRQFLPPTPAEPVTASTPVEVSTTPKPEAPTAAIDPLALDLGADVLDIKAEVPAEPEVEAEPEEIVNHAVAFEPVGAALGDGELSAPLELTTVAKEAMIVASLKRVCAAGLEGADSTVWVPLVSRLITRGLEVLADEESSSSGTAGRAEPLREVLFAFVTSDLQARTELARLWLNEEWYTSHRRQITENRPYDRWLRRFLEHVSQTSKNQDKELLQFMMDLPELPAAEISRLEDMCLNAEQMQLGFSTLRELTILRPSVRPIALDVLLGLTTHSDKRVRNAAIVTVKKWVPDVKELSETIVKFAVSLLERLKNTPLKVEEPEEKKTAEEGGAEADEEGEADMAMDATPPPEAPKPPYALVKGGEVVDRLDPASTTSEVVQHVELLLALCVKEPSLLRPIFEQYQNLQPFAREALEELIQPLMRALGIKHEGLLEIIGDFPEGSDILVLKVFDILVGKTKMPSNVIALVKQVATKRDLDPRFYALIMPECTKTEIVRYLPRVVSLLNGTAQQKAAIRSIFLSIIAPPAHFSSINSLRTRSDSLSPVELMVYLHKHDSEMGLKKTIEAISICFSMSDGFRPEILAAFMQQVVDEPNLPNLFLRTVIQAVTTYKSLQPFVSTTLLSRLIGKKVWTVAPLWEGFVRLAKAIAPTSFAALLQLPKEQLSEFVQKQPSMRAPLREYVLKKGGANNARTAAVLEAIGDEPEAAAPTPTL